MGSAQNTHNNLITMGADAGIMKENALLKYQNSAFKEEVARLRDENAELRQQNADLNNQVADLKTAVEYYEGQARLYRHELFGQSSEKSRDERAQKRELVIERAEGALEAIPQPKADPYDSESKYLEYDVKAHIRRKRVGKREDDLSNLPVERIDYELPEGERGCAECGNQMDDIGVEIRRELVFIPAKYIVREHATHIYACKQHKDNGGHTPIVEAESPAPLISRSLASPSAVAFLSVQKYVYSVPIYRLEQGFKRDGFFLSRQTMTNWIIQCVDLYLYKPYNILIKYLLTGTVLHSDATTHQVLREKGREAKTKSYEWVYRTTGCAERQIVIYQYTQTKGRVNPEEFLKPFRGFLHCDGDSTYQKLDGITLSGCWSHSRRRFHNVIKALPKGEDAEGTYADRAMACINYLFHLERKFKGLTPQERYIKRLALSKPVADSFFEWAKAVEGLVSPDFPIGGAIGYALNQQGYLMNVFLDGRLEFTNNRAERSIKTFVLGRKNWLFSNTPDGAYASSVIYSIVGTALENGLDPFRYIQYLLEKLPSTGGAAALLPWSADLPEECRSRFNRKGVLTDEDDEYELYD